MAKIILNFPGSGGTRPVAKYDEICERRIINLKTSPQLDWVLFFNDEENKELVLSADTNPSSAIGRKAEITISYETNDGFICESHNVLLCQKNADSVITTYTYGTAIVNKTVDCVGGKIELNTINMPYTATTSGVETTGFTSATINSVTVAKCTAATGCTTTGSGNAIPGGTIEYTITQSNCESCSCNNLTVKNIGTIPYSGGTYTVAEYNDCLTGFSINSEGAPSGMISSTGATNRNVTITFGENGTSSRQCTCSITYGFEGESCSKNLGSFTQEAAPSPKATLTLSNGTTVTIPCDGNSTLNSTDITNKVTASDVVSVHVENCVTKIGDYAFAPDRGFTSLTSITMEDSVTEIGVQVHSDSYGPTSLKEITFSRNLVSIGDSAFWGCSKLTSINLPNGLKTIGNDSFRNCSGLTTVVLPDSVKSIGDQCFYDCKKITTFTFGTGFTGVTSFGQSLQGTDALTKVTCKAITPPKIDSFMFCSGPITQQCRDKFRIYVPRNSVSAYEHAPGWDKYYIDDDGF